MNAGLSVLAFETREKRFRVSVSVLSGICDCVAVLVASERLYPLLHIFVVITIKVFLYSLLVPALGLSDAPPQVSLCLFIDLQVPRFKC